MDVLAHPDPVALEAELIALVRRAKERDPLAAVLVVVPTRALVAHVQRRLAEALGALLAVEVHHYRSLAWRIFEAAGESAPRPLPSPVREAIVEDLLEETAGEARTRFFHERPGARGRLGHALDELREAGVEPGELIEAAGEHPDDAWLAGLYGAYVRHLERLEALGWCDEASLSRRAAALVEFYVARARPRLVLHHGAYELIGVHLELLRELDRAAGVRVLLPCAPGAPATRYAERFAREFVLEGGALKPLAPRRTGLLGERLEALWDRESRPETLARGLRLHHVQGAAAEVELALRHALAAVGEGERAHEIALVARSWEPYAAACETALRQADVPWFGSLEAPLAREPLARDFLLALRAAAEDFPRAATVEVLRSPRLDWRALGVERPPAARVEGLSREAGVLKGLEAWTRTLPAWAQACPEEQNEADEGAERRAWREARVEACRKIAAAVGALAERLDAGKPRTWGEHASRLSELLRELFVRPGEHDEQAAEALQELFDATAALEALAAEPVPFAELVEWLEAAVARTTLPRTEKDRGGLRILDAMQARGMTFRRVFVLGLHEGGFLRQRLDDPLLPDRLRERLRERGRPLPLRSDARDEERLLLALALGAAEEALDLSWQRADDSGRARTASLALREIARATLGEEASAALAERAARLPTHPRERLSALAQDPGRLTPLEARMWLGMEAADPERAARALAGLDPHLDRGFALLRAIERFDPGDLRFDGRVGAVGLGGRPLSVRAFEQLGRCPLQFFFRQVLRVRPLEEEAAFGALDAVELGSAVHAVLERLYEDLAGRELAHPIREEALRRLPDAWREGTRELAAAWRERLPLLWNAIENRWLEALRAFVKADLDALAEGGERIGCVEQRAEQALELDGGTRVRLVARFDREVHDGRGACVRICDYKTGKTEPAKLVDLKEMLKGRVLQMGLYHLLSGKPVQVLPVRPDRPPAGGDGFPEPFEGFGEDRLRRGFRETLSVLWSLAVRGVFPLNPDRHCKSCDYEPACRRTHPPTLERETHAPDSRDFADLRYKNKSDKPCLEDVRAEIRLRARTGGP